MTRPNFMQAVTAGLADTAERNARRRAENPTNAAMAETLVHPVSQLTEIYNIGMAGLLTDAERAHLRTIMLTQINRGTMIVEDDE